MSSASEILVIILSVVLTLFLIVGIVLLIYLIVLTRQIRKVTKSAGQTIDNFGSVVSRTSRIIQPIFVTEMINNFLKKFKKSKKGDK